MRAQIYLDMDGVVVDWIGGALAAHSRSFPILDVRWTIPAQLGFEGDNEREFWRPMETADFWANLAPLADGIRLYNKIVVRYGARALNILSSAKVRTSADGKIDWLRQNLPMHVDCAVFAHQKHRVAGPTKILIDDHDANVQQFVAAGGHALLVPRPWNERRAECNEQGEFDVYRLWRELTFTVDQINAT